MSSLTRRIQRSATRANRTSNPVTPCQGRGSKLGVSNPDAKDKLASEARKGKFQGFNAVSFLNASPATSNDGGAA